jgi:anti-sigma factor RsiW
MTHLHDAEFIDYVEDTLPAARAAHLEACDTCRRQAADVSGMLAETAAVDAPEPSPLFWDHFSARVSEAVAVDAARQASWFGRVNRLLMPVGVAAALVIAALSAWLLPRVARAPQPPVAQLGSNHVGVASDTAFEREMIASDAPVDAQNAEVWDVLTAAASDVGIDEAHAAGLRAHPGAIDGAVQRLNQAELKELGRLLQSEMKRSSN